MSQATQDGGSSEFENTQEMVLVPSSEVLSQSMAQAKSYSDAVQNHYSSAKIKPPRAFEKAWFPWDAGSRCKLAKPVLRYLYQSGFWISLKLPKSNGTILTE